MTCVVKGLLGWSNKRRGLEFYRYNERIIPRHESEWGELLSDEISENLEGSPIVVIILDRSLTSQEVQEMADGIASQVVEYD